MITVEQQTIAKVALDGAGAGLGFRFQSVTDIGEFTIEPTGDGTLDNAHSARVMLHPDQPNITADNFQETLDEAVGAIVDWAIHRRRNLRKTA